LGVGGAAGVAALALGLAAVDALVDLVVNGVLQAVLADGTVLADLFGSEERSVLAPGREEELGVGASAGGL
jgi:hypothetical protein